MESDRFFQGYNASERRTAQEFLTTCLPFLTEGLCNGCADGLRDRIRLIDTEHELPCDGPQAEELDGGVERSLLNGKDEASFVASCVENSIGLVVNGNDEASSVARGSVVNREDETSSVGSCVDNAMGLVVNGNDEASYVASCVENTRSSAEVCSHTESVGWDTDQEKESLKGPISWADMAELDELKKERKNNLDDVMVEQMGAAKLKKTEYSREQRERMRFTRVGRKKDFVCLERIDGRIVNILNGLELHTGVFSSAEQKKIVNFVYDLQEKGRNNEFGEHTYSEPKKWMRGKGRVTIQFGCCYNYAQKNGIPPGILHNAVADPIPNLFKIMIKRMIGWHVLPTDCVPDSCIVNIYEPGDCIPPHIDNHDFVRPFCTVSFLSECDIVFGSNLKIDGPGEFIGPASIPLPVGSVLVLSGNGADVAKHSVPAVPSKRISITFRKMDKAKWPHGFKLEPDLQNIKPYDSSAGFESSQEEKEKEAFLEIQTMRKPRQRLDRSKKPLRFDEAEGLMERRSRHGSMNDYGSGERRAKMPQRPMNGNPDIDYDSSFRRQSRWAPRHPRGRFQTNSHSQRVW